MAVVVTAIAFALWTWLTLGTTTFATIDAFSQRPGIDPFGARGQILAAIAIVTTPTVVYTVLAGVTLWAARRRLHNLAWAVGMSIPLGWGGAQLTKLLVRRPDPTPPRRSSPPRGGRTRAATWWPPPCWP